MNNYNLIPRNSLITFNTVLFAYTIDSVHGRNFYDSVYLRSF